MEKGTYTFSKKELFKSLTKNIEEKYSVTVHLANIKGKRWSFIAGNDVKNGLYNFKKFKINNDLGIIIFKWDKLKEGQRDGIIAKYKDSLDDSDFSIPLNVDKIIDFLESKDTKSLFDRADRIRRKYFSNQVHIRAIIEFSNYCKKDCLYCGLRKSNKKLYRYRFTFDEIYNIAKQINSFGYKTIVLQSGEDDYYNTDKLCKLISRIKKDTDCAITLSIGEKTFDEYKKLKEAGVDRYLLKFETSDQNLFKKLKPDSNYENRLECVEILRELDYQVGSGNIIGLPGQTKRILAQDILLMENMDLDMIGMGPFIPHGNTPFKKEKAGTLDLSLKTLAITRILNKIVHIPATTALASIDLHGRQKGLEAGANVIMPNLTPSKYREYYEIYPNKVYIDKTPSQCRKDIEKMIIKTGRIISKDYGHSLKLKI